MRHPVRDGGVSIANRFRVGWLALAAALAAVAGLVIAGWVWIRLELPPVAARVHEVLVPPEDGVTGAAKVITVPDTAGMWWLVPIIGEVS